MSRTARAFVFLPLSIFSVIAALKIAAASSPAITLSTLKYSVQELLKISQQVDDENESEYESYEVSDDKIGIYRQRTKLPTKTVSGYIIFLRKGDSIVHAFKVQLNNCGKIPKEVSSQNLVCMKQDFHIGYYFWGRPTGWSTRTDIVYYTPGFIWYYRTSNDNNDSDSGKLFAELNGDHYYVHLPNKNTIEVHRDESSSAVIPFRTREDFLGSLVDIWNERVFRTGANPLATETMCFYKAHGSKEFKVTMSFHLKKRKIHIKETLLCLMENCKFYKPCMLDGAIHIKNVHFIVDSGILKFNGGDEVPRTCKWLRPVSSPITREC